MAMGHKYATLPDLDSAPELYETPDVPEDSSTAPNGRTHSASPAASEKDLDDSASGIDHHQLRPREARDRLAAARIDARDVDFSDRISDKRKSYHASRFRGRNRGRVVLGTTDSGDDEDGQEEDETFEERVARLRRELEEVKAEAEKRQVGLDSADEADGIAQLSELLQEVRTRSGGHDIASTLDSAQQQMNGAGDEHSRKNYPPPLPLKRVTAEYPTTPPVQGAEENIRILSKVTNFEARLTSLEEALGTNSTSLSSKPTAVCKPVLSSLNMLMKQMAVLSNTTVPSLESMQQQISQTTQLMERLEEARKDARAARDALQQRPSFLGSSATHSGDDGSGAGGTPSLPEDPEQTTKIEALYSSLSSMETMAPLLPAVLERLRTLRIIHSNAGEASENLAALEQKQRQMNDDIKQWRKGLENVERVVRSDEGINTENTKAIEAWVRDLEMRIEKLP